MKNKLVLFGAALFGTWLLYRWINGRGQGVSCTNDPADITFSATVNGQTASKMVRASEVASEMAALRMLAAQAPSATVDASATGADGTMLASYHQNGAPSTATATLETSKLAQLAERC